VLSKKDNISLIGYLDDDKNKQNIFINSVPVLGPLNKSNNYYDCFFISSFGSEHNYLDKKEIIEKMNLPKEKYISIIHFNSHISKYSKVGRGCFLAEKTSIGTNSSVGNHVKLLENTIVSHDSVISDYCTIANSVSMGGRVFLEESCYIGMNASIKSDIRIGKGSIVGMGTVIIKDVPPYSTIVGNPGRILEKPKKD
jgi:sugar O-acyltransferase (sialic acid O-acetyltransferase NeuD family)